jgi:hypothetical protein
MGDSDAGSGCGCVGDDDDDEGCAADARSGEWPPSLNAPPAQPPRSLLVLVSSSSMCGGIAQCAFFDDPFFRSLPLSFFLVLPSACFGLLRFFSFLRSRSRSWWS